MITQESQRQNYKDEEERTNPDRTGIGHTGMRRWQTLIRAEALGALGISTSSGS